MKKTTQPKAKKKASVRDLTVRRGKDVKGGAAPINNGKRPAVPING